MTRFPQFLLAICFGLLLIAAHQWHRKRQLARWVLACVICAGAGTAIYFAYDDLNATSTEVWNDTRYVIGDPRTDPAGVELQQACRATNQDRACDSKTLLDFCHGHLTEIWTPASVVRVQRRAVLYYVGASLFFMGAMVSLLHALRWALPPTKEPSS